MGCFMRFKKVFTAIKCPYLQLNELEDPSLNDFWDCCINFVFE